MDWKEQIDFLYKTQKLRWAYVFDSKGNIVAKFDDATKPENVKKDLLDFLSFWKPQKFKVVFKDKSGATDNEKFVYYFDTREPEEALEILPNIEVQTMQGTQFTDSQIEDKIQKGILQGLETLELKTKLEDVKAKEKRLENLGEQFSIVAEKVLMIFAPQIAPQVAPIQGIEIIDSPVDLQTAFQILENHLGAKTIIELSKKVDKNPSKYIALIPFA